jgi:hypothetical protein
MSYEKYLKYKSKYLNLKAQLHNEKLINQNGGANSEDSLQSLGSSPASKNSVTDPDDSLQSLGSSPESDATVASVISTPATTDPAPTTAPAPTPTTATTTAPVPAPTTGTTAPTPTTTATAPAPTPTPPINPPEKNNTFNDLFELFGGKKLVRKERNEFSDSDYDTTESSLLSFESVESIDSDDVF